MSFSQIWCTAGHAEWELSGTLEVPYRDFRNGRLRYAQAILHNYEVKLVGPTPTHEVEVTFGK